MPDVPVLASAAGAAGADPAAAGKRRMPWLIIGIAAAVLIIGLGAAFLLMRGHSATGHAKAAAAKPAGPPIYLALDPPFVVNFQADQLVRFLQVSVEVMSRDQKTLDLLKANDPVARNDLLILFANQKYATLATPAGKEAAAHRGARQPAQGARAGGRRPEASSRRCTSPAS